MSISVTDAITKWCPMVRLDSNVATYNRIERHPVPVGAMCLGPKCMMWHSESDTHGDCGLKTSRQVAEPWGSSTMQAAQMDMQAAAKKAHTHPTPASGVKKDGPAV